MGKYINSYSRFINESYGPTQSLLDIASKYIDATPYESETDPVQLMDSLVATIKREKGQAAADEFTMDAMQSIPVNEECTCHEDLEMNEPCEACKKHAEEMANEDDY